MCLCFRLCAHEQLVQWWQVEGSWRAEYPWLGPRPHRPPSSTDHRCPCLRISDWLWIQSCIGTSTNNANIYRYLRYSRAWGTILSILPRNHQFSFDCCCWTITLCDSCCLCLLVHNLPQATLENLGISPRVTFETGGMRIPLCTKMEYSRGVIVGVVEIEELFFNKVWFPHCISFLLDCNDLFIFDYSVRRFFRLNRNWATW